MTSIIDLNEQNIFNLNNENKRLSTLADQTQRFYQNFEDIEQSDLPLHNLEFYAQEEGGELG